MKESSSYKVFKVVNTCILLLVVLVTLYPFIVVIAQSLSSEAHIIAGEVNLLPKGFNVDTYKAVMSDKMFWINYKNTVVYTVVGTLISMVLTTLLAYGLSKKHLAGRGALLFFAAFTMFFQGGLIPNYVLVSRLGLTNTMWAIVLPGALSIFNMLIMKTFFENLPVELEEAAAIDGLNQFGIFFKIALPLSKAIIATMILFYAVGHWNSWFSAFLYLDNRELFPVTIYLRNMISAATGAMGVGGTTADDMTKISANIKSVTIILTLLPIMTIYPFVQKYFVKGVMLGSIK